MSSHSPISEDIESKIMLLNLNEDEETGYDKNDLEKVSNSSDEAILDDFLTLKAKRLISSLQNSKASLESSIKIYKTELLRMREKLNDAEKVERKRNKELEIAKREIAKKEQQLKKKTSELENNKQELHKKFQMSIDLNQEIQNWKKDLREEKKKSSALNSQNKSLRTQTEKLNEVIEKERLNFQSIQDQLQLNIKSHDEANRHLRKQTSDLILVVKEQQKLIEVLRQQNAVILGANVTKCLEEEFKEVIKSISDRKT